MSERPIYIKYRVDRFDSKYGRWTTRRYCLTKEKAFSVRRQLEKENPGFLYRVFNMVKNCQEKPTECYGCDLCERVEEQK